jgi:hypothetical protein
VITAKFSGCIITYCYCVDLSLVILCNVNGVNKLMHAHFLSVKKIFCEVLLSDNHVPFWLHTLASYNPPSSTSGETLPALQVLSKGPIGRVFLVR